MSETDTMFNERDWRCAAVQLLFTTDPRYDNRTIDWSIAGLPKITGTCPEWWKQRVRLRLWSLVWFQVRATSCHLTSSKSAWKSAPKFAEERGDPLVQSSSRWQTLGVAAGLGTRPQVQRDPGLASEGVIWLCTLLSLPPPPPLTWTHWTTSLGHSSRTSSTWPPITPKPAWSLPSAEYSPSSRRRL